MGVYKEETLDVFWNPTESREEDKSTMPKRNYDIFKAKPMCAACIGTGFVPFSSKPKEDKMKICDCILEQAKEQYRQDLQEVYRKKLRVTKENSFFNPDGCPASLYQPAEVRPAVQTLNVSSNYKKQAYWAESVGKDLARCYLVRLTQTKTGTLALYGDVECVIRMKVKMYHGEGLHDCQILWARTNKTYKHIQEFIENSVYGFESTTETLIKDLGFLPLCFETAKSDKEYRDLVDLYANTNTWDKGPLKLNLLPDDGKTYELTTLEIEEEDENDDSGEDSIDETLIHDKYTR